MIVRHSRFRYVVFNTIMRCQASAKARFYVKQKTIQWTADDLRSAFEEDSPESEALLNSRMLMECALSGLEDVDSFKL